MKPIKKVDKDGSHRLSNEFIGTASVRGSPELKKEAPSPKRNRPVSERGRAGQALVEEVVLGVLDSVSKTQALIPVREESLILV